MGKIFANDISDKGFVSKIYKDLVRLNTLKTNNQIKNGYRRWIDISPEETKRCPTNKKRCLSSFFIKTTVKYHLTLMRMDKINNTRNVLEKMWIKKTFLHCWWECKLVKPLWKTVWRFLKKLKIKPPYDLAIAHQDIYTKVIRTLMESDTYILMFIAALLTIAKLWK